MNPRYGIVALMVVTAGCSSGPQLTVVVPELELYDGPPQGKNAGRVGTATLGQIYSGQCGGFCQLELPTGATGVAYKGGTVPYPIAGVEMPLLADAEMRTSYDLKSAAKRTFKREEKIRVAMDLGSVPNTLTSVIENGVVVGYVPRVAVELPAGSKPVAAIATATPAPVVPCADRLAAFAPGTGETLSRADIGPEPAKTETVKLPDHELPCAAKERDEDCRAVGVDWNFSQDAVAGMRVDYHVKDLPGGRQSVVVRRTKEVSTPARGPGVRVEWRPANASADPLPGAAQQAGLTATEISRTPANVRTYEIRCPADRSVRTETAATATTTRDAGLALCPITCPAGSALRNEERYAQCDPVNPAASSTIAKFNGNQIIQCANWIGGRRTGPSRRWWSNGKPRAEGAFADEKKTGAWTLWHENGTKASTSHWANGMKTGHETVWWPNGQKQAEGDWVPGEYSERGAATLTVSHSDGVWQAWYENGVRQFECAYKAGKNEGRCTEWDATGKKIGEGLFKDGKLVSGSPVAMESGNYYDRYESDLP